MRTSWLSKMAEGARRRWYWFAGIGAVVVVLPLVLAVVLSRNSPCGPAPALLSTAPLMKAAQHRCYGPPGVLKLEYIPRPVPGADAVLVKVRAAALNPLDLHLLRGSPYPIRVMTGFGTPVDTGLGVDFAGIVVAVGAEVKRFKVGDEVFGAAADTFAEYVAVPESHAIILKPKSLSFDEAAAVPVAAVTALQALRDRGGVRPGDKVLINGASGGVGTYAVQLAKTFGAEVTAVCSGRNEEMVRSLGANHVLDYTQRDFTAGPERYNLILDAVGNHSLEQLRHALTQEGVLVMIAGPPGDWVGPISPHIQALVQAPFSSGKVIALTADPKQEDLQSLADLMQAGRMHPFVERIYPLAQLSEALDFLEKGHARGKVVIEML